MANDKRTVLSTKRARDRRQRALRRADKKSADPSCPDASAQVAGAGGGASPSRSQEPRKPAYVAPVLAIDLKLDEPVSSGEEGTLASSGDDASDLEDPRGGGGGKCGRASGRGGGVGVGVGAARTSSNDNQNADGGVGVGDGDAIDNNEGEGNDDGSRQHDDSDDDDDDDDELVIVGRAPRDFCSRFVPPDAADGERDGERVGDGSTCDGGSSSSAASAGEWGDCRAFSVTVPSFRETREGFTTFTLALRTRGRRAHAFALERRFSEFVALAAALRAEREAGAGARWEPPPRTWLRVTQPAALEARRRLLEQSLARLLAMDGGAMSRRAPVREFLRLDAFAAQVADEL